MQEHVTEAMVLETMPRGEYDREAVLYTKKLGIIEVFTISSRKPTSKFSPHLDILNLVTVRLIEKNRITVTDALTIDRFDLIRHNPALRLRALELLYLVRSLAPRFIEESEVWNELISQFSKGVFNLHPFLHFFGYERTHAHCAVCDALDPNLFSVYDHAFFCSRCSSQFPRNELIYLV